MSGKNKRNYIRRKKYLANCVAQIKAILDFVRLVRGEKLPPMDTQKEAMAHAQAIEAVCWCPHSRLSADNYEKLMAAKTLELCRTLLKKWLPALDLAQLQKMTARLSPERLKSPQSVLPVPVFPPSRGLNLQIETDELGAPNDPFVASFQVDVMQMEDVPDVFAWRLDDESLVDLAINRIEEGVRDEGLFLGL
jgi:hypothetical protein